MRCTLQLYDARRNVWHHKTAQACLSPEDSPQGARLHTEPSLFSLTQPGLFTVASGPRSEASASLCTPTVCNSYALFNIRGVLIDPVLFCRTSGGSTHLGVFLQTDTRYVKDPFLTIKTNLLPSTVNLALIILG